MCCYVGPTWSARREPGQATSLASATMQQQYPIRPRQCRKRDCSTIDSKVDDVASRLTYLKLGDDGKWPCRVCGARFKWLYWMGDDDDGTYTCSWCQDRLWNKFCELKNVAYDDWDKSWAAFCTFVRARVRVREPWNDSRNPQRLTLEAQ